MEKSDKYHPSLFSREQEVSLDSKQEAVIPQTTLYDMPIQTNSTPAKKHLIVFGFSSSNKKNVLEQIQKLTDNFRKEEGKNYVKIWADDMSSLDDILKYNHKMINGEIIGVYRQNYGVIEDSDIYLKKKGVFKLALEYLFGE